MKQILKEKEQENRISKLKIKEMRRLMKHNQLKPIAGSPKRFGSPIKKVGFSQSPDKKKEVKEVKEVKKPKR